MKRTLLGSSLLASLLALSAMWAGSAPATASVIGPEGNVDVGGSFALLRLAVPAGDEVGDILRRDAQLSAGFEVIDRRSIPAALIKEGGFDKAQWEQIGAQAVIKNEKDGGQTKFRLFDLAKGGQAVLSRGYPSDDPRKAAHRFMNEVIKYYTGIPGVFGSRIAFVRTQRNPTVTKNVYTMEMDGGNVSSITNLRTLNILPSIGPGGEVLFTSYAKRNPDLWMARGGAPERISKYPGLNLGGTMSPDGSSIAVTLSKDGNSEIYTIDPGGNIKARLTNNAAIDGSPSWGGGGSQIAFVSNRAGGPQVFRMSAGGGGQTRVTRQGDYNQTPDWSPGEGDAGNWIAFAGRDSANRFDVFALHVSSGKLKRITQGGGRHNDPTWSPDGRLIAFTGPSGGIYVANQDGNNQNQVGRAGSTPDWGPRAY